MQNISTKPMNIKWKDIKLFSKNDVNGVPVESLPAEDIETTANKIILAKPSTRMRVRTRNLFKTLKKDLKNGGATRSIKQKRVVENIKGEPVLLKDHIAGKQYEVLKPLKKVMKMALQSIGVSPGKTIDVVAEQFYNNVIRPSKKTGIANFNYDYPELQPSQMTYDFADNAKDVITEAILKFVRVARRKDATGQQLTKVEQILSDGSKIVEKNIEDTAKSQAASKLGESLLFDRKTQFIIIGIIVAIILIVLAFRK